MVSGNHLNGTWIFPAITVKLSDCVTTIRVSDDLRNEFEALSEVLLDPELFIHSSRNYTGDILFFFHIAAQGYFFFKI
jgi:hypothetical protein